MGDSISTSVIVAPLHDLVVQDGAIHGTPLGMVGNPDGWLVGPRVVRKMVHDWY